MVFLDRLGPDAHSKRAQPIMRCREMKSPIRVVRPEPYRAEEREGKVQSLGFRMGEIEEGLVDAYIYVRALSVRPSMKRHDTLRLVRSKVYEYQFDFLHVVHGWVYLIKSKALTQFIDNGHIRLPLPDDTAFIETLSNGEDWQTDFSNIWIKVGIKRPSLELVTTKIYRSCHFKVFFNIQYGGVDRENRVFEKVFEKWKNSKQFLLEAAKAEADSYGLSPPSSVIKLELFEHQQQGLRWMVDREEYPDDDDDEMPPFWEECNGVYRTLHSSFMTLKKPQRIRGGILADESGMGKTCTLLSLIAYTKYKHYSSSHPNNIDVGSAVTDNDSIISDQKPFLIGGNLSSTGDRDAASHVRKKLMVNRNLLHFDELHFEWKPTLVVCPPSVLATWKRQIKQCTWPGSLKVFTYSEKNKPKDPSLLRRHDIVLATYNAVRKQQSDSLLYQIEWWRVIFDDVHVLKAPSPTTPFASLKAKRRWAVTGWPIHKDVHDDLLVAIMECLHLEQTCYSIDPLWQAEVLMGIFSLQRTMPRKLIENHPVILSKNEQDVYNYLAAEAKANGTYSRDPLALRAAVLNLWLCCNSLYLYRLTCAEKKDSSKKIQFQDINRRQKLLENWITVLQEEKDYACPVCMGKAEDMIITRCAHIFCRRCIRSIFKQCKGKKLDCPLCRSLLTKRHIYSTQRGPSVEEKIKAFVEQASLPASISSKISALLNLLLKLRNEEPNRKSVVLSQFQKMLILAAEVLSASGFSVMRMDAISNAKGRAKTVEEFTNANPPVVLLSTFKFLGTTPGLDLSNTSPNIYMIEPCWNDLFEAQALSRIQQFGKRGDGNVVRLVCKNSIEERVLEIRNQKQEYGSLNSKKDLDLSDFTDNRRLLGF